MDRPSGLSCPSGHRFDAARQGYVNLLTGRGTRFTPDSAQMILARERVQDAGVFAALSAELEKILQDALPGHASRQRPGNPLLLDCGSGTGHYLHPLLDAAPQASGIAVDLSTAGLKRAARHPRTLALAWDLWQPLPLSDSCVDLLLDVFAPRNVEEYARVLRPGGTAIVVTPREGHLAQLHTAGLLSMQRDKLSQVQTQMGPAFGAPVSTTRITAETGVDADLASDLVFMGPAGHHRELGAIRDQIRAHRVSHVTVDLDVSLWRG